MTPTPKEVSTIPENLDNQTSPDINSDSIVISGMSGLFPESHSVKEFSEILYNKKNPISLQERWMDYKHPELPQYVGTVPDVDRFDAQFFAVHYRLGHFMDPMSRKILEQTYQALYDAGLNPGHVNGKKIAVFVGSSFSEMESESCVDTSSKLGLGILGGSKTMFANRISYWLNLKGPSLSIDEADCSSTCALEQAYSSLRRGDCDAAIVGGAHLCLQPHVFIHHGRIGMMSKDGKTKSFADDSHGYALSDSINVLVLQKSKDALRCYAELVHVKNEFISVITDEMGPRFGYNRNPQVTADFIKSFYQEAGVSPQAVEYVEGYGTGVPDVDKSELEAIEKVYCDNRKDPLLVGSVSSNIGLTEAASGTTAITKLLLGYQKGKLAANMNCENPRKDIKALRDGRMRIVTEHQPFSRKYTAINCMSTTGVNSHVLLKGHYKPKDLSRYVSPIPRLVVLSARQEVFVENEIANLKFEGIDAEAVALLHHIHSKNVSGHLGRGYTILDTDADGKTVSLSEKVEYFDDAQSPLWFVYSGMGSQWAGMGTQLMRIPIFAKAIQRCDKLLKPFGLDIVHIITSPDKAVFSNILHCFVGIAAIQIGLTDILRELGLKPDGIIGHSVGELGCAYADGCMTADEMILSAMSRGRVSLETKIIPGSMAAVGLGYNQIAPLCPPEIDVACHNSGESCTISGPAEIMREFVAELTAKGIFAKEVDSASIPYHSRYIAHAGPNLLKYLKEIIKTPKRRSERWLSTSVPQEKWNESSAQYCSAEYHTNNLLSPVLFEETIPLIPNNAVLIEVAPHGLLQAILKRALPAGCRNVSLTKRGHKDNTLFLLQAIGDLYMYGYTPDLQVLYPKVQFPVSTETPMLSHLVEWVHTEKWFIPTFNRGENVKTASCKFVMSIHDEEYSYLKGHVVQGKMCYPFAAALVAAWDTFAMSSGLPKRGVSVQFRDVCLFAQPLLLDQQPLRLQVALHRGTGRFEIMSESSKVMTGFLLRNYEKPAELYYLYETDAEQDMEVSSDDVYQLLNDRGFMYSGEFRSIERASVTLKEAEVAWRDNWVTLIDGILQLNALQQKHHTPQLTHIGKLGIDVEKHYNERYITNSLKAKLFDVYDITRCGGVFMRNPKYRNLPAAHHNLELCPSSSEVNHVNHAGPDAPVTNRTLQIGEIGKIDSLQWVELPECEQTNLTVKVHFAGLSTLDVKRAAGITASDSNSFGMDYSGIINSGERVMGIVASGAASSQVQAQPEFLWPVPEHWTLEDAATVPLAYAQAFYALIIKGRLQPGWSVLVHGGTGALGQAVIAIALAYKCQVFATVSDVRKKALLRKLFPQLKDDHIGNSRDLSFADYVLTATNGRGCKVIISCVKGSCKDFSIKCVQSFGVIIDTVQIQDRENYEYGMYNLMLARSYLTIDFTSVLKNNNTDEMKVLQNMVSEGIAGGYVVPLTRVTYAPHEVPRAFKLLGSSRHRGRVLLRAGEHAHHVLHKIMCNPENSHVLFWDDDAFGAQIADRLISGGARKLYIYCTKLTSYQRLRIRGWQQLGVQVVISAKDLAECDHLSSLVNDITSQGTIEGIYVIVTKTNSKKDTSDLKNNLNNLDSLSRLVCPKLRYFLVASTVKSVAAVGQEICSSRAKCRHPATHVDLSSINQEELTAGGTVAEMVERALCSEHIRFVVQKKNVPTPSLLQQIAALADINIAESTDVNATLQELGMAEEQSQSIWAFLDATYNISLNEADIPLLTIDRINELEKSVTEVALPDIRGLATFFTNTGHDELDMTTDLALLSTLQRAINDEIFISERYLCIVPGMEGNYERFSTLSERLKLPVLVIQPGLDRPRESVDEIAERYAQILMKKTEIQDNFFLLGYESGVPIALALAAKLEENGLTGTVFCLGFAPDELKAELEEQLSELETEEQLENAVVRHMFTLLSGEEPAGLDAALELARTWAEKVDACVRVLLLRMRHSAQYARDLIDAALARILQVRHYRAPSFTLRSQLVLLRAASTRTPQPVTSLQQYSRRPVIVHQLRSALAHVSRDTRCPALVNRYLGDDLKKAFDEKNLCESYKYIQKNLL